MTDQITVTASPLPNPNRHIIEQDEDILLAMLIWGEARSESERGKLAVGSVVRNRVLSGKFGGDTWRNVILKPWQFSCFNLTDPNRGKLLEPLKHDTAETWDSCYGAARSVYTGEISDETGRATHYYVAGSKTPFWANLFVLTVQIGRHLFFRDPKAFRDENRPEPEPPLAA